MGNTTIEWTDMTWNPVTGCTKVSQGCHFCYAERVFPRAYGKVRKFTDVVCHPERLDQPLHWKKPRRIFVNSMSDLFHEAVPFSFVSEVFAAMGMASQHTFQVLTKRPKRMMTFVDRHRADVLDKFQVLRIDCHQNLERNGKRLSPAYSERAWPGFPFPNLHLGVSVEDQEAADERIPLLLQTPAAVRFVSYEPALAGIRIEQFLGDNFSSTYGGFEHGIDWVICGGESGPNARPMHPDWARSVRDRCQAAGVPYFFKQWGEWLPKLFYQECGKGKDYQWGVLDQAGEWFSKTTPWNGRQGDASESREYTMIKVGKKAAGAMLDGREWKEFPS